MPGLILYNRRWSLGSDDLLLPGIFLASLHAIWLTVITILLCVTIFDKQDQCQVHYWQQLVGYLCLWSGSFVLELCIMYTATRGTVFNDAPRSSMQYLIYIKQGMWCVEFCWVIFGIHWLSKYYPRSVCSLSYTYKNVLLALVVCNLVSISIFLLIIWCSWDYAGRSWLKLKKYQEKALQSSSKHRDSRYSGIHRRSGGTSRNWRHRKVRRAYQSSWNSRCRVLFCCARKDNKSKTSFAEIAGLLSEFFRDLDVVPTDVLVGLVLLRKRQQAARQRTISQPTNNVYDFLSGVKVTPDTQFVALNNPQELDKLRETVHYMYFALAAYGWPMYLLHNKTVPVLKAAWKLFSSLRCCCISCCNHKTDLNSVILEDNCCLCNYSALKQVCQLDSTEIVYVTYHVDVGETPFFIGVDFDKARIVISIRGTLSMQDIITDLNAESEIIPLEPVNEEFKGHKGMVQAAEYIHRKLKEERLLEKAFNWKPEAGTREFPLVCVGHSLGGGTAAILAILLRQEFPSITCFSFSPPGGLLSEAAMIASKEFMTSVVVGKDVVPRLGLHQMETLRHDLMATIKQSKKNKWETLFNSVLCTAGNQNNSDDEMEASPTAINIHPLDSSINLSVHQPLFPPGHIIHIVRHHPKDKKYARKEPIYQAVWADNKDFDEVLISKCMVQDHMPDNVLDALEKASCIHAWHNVYTSRTICGPTGQAGQQTGQQAGQRVGLHTQAKQMIGEFRGGRTDHREVIQQEPQLSCLKQDREALRRSADPQEQATEPLIQKEVRFKYESRQSETHYTVSVESRPASQEDSPSKPNQTNVHSGCGDVVCDKSSVKKEKYMETSLDAVSLLCSTSSNNNLEFQKSLLKTEEYEAGSNSLDEKHSPVRNGSIFKQSLPQLYNGSIHNHLIPSVELRLESETPNSLLEDKRVEQRFIRSSHSCSDVRSGSQPVSVNKQEVLLTSENLTRKPDIDDLSLRRKLCNGKDLRELRTASDIFSFYDISREEATTV